MSIERLVRIFAGLNFLWLTAFVGANLFQSGFTGVCPLESILKRLGVCSLPARTA